MGVLSENDDTKQRKNKTLILYCILEPLHR